MTFVHADVSDEAAVRDLVATARNTYGRLDCAVNNAGYRDDRHDRRRAPRVGLGSS